MTVWCSPAAATALLGDVDWLVLDLETTGLTPGRHLITEFSAASFAGSSGCKFVAEWTADEVGGQLPAAIPRRVSAAVRPTTVVVAHNLAFDLSFLAALPAASESLFRPSRWVCTMRMLARREALDSLAATLGVPVTGRHTATGDVQTLARVLAGLVERTEVAGGALVQDMELGLPPGWRSGAARRRTPETPGWGDVRAGLDDVVPGALLTADQREAFAAVRRLLVDERAGPAHPLEFEAVLSALRAADVTASGLDVLRTEIG